MCWLSKKIKIKFAGSSSPMDLLLLVALHWCQVYLRIGRNRLACQEGGENSIMLKIRAQNVSTGSVRQPFHQDDLPPPSVEPSFARPVITAFAILVQQVKTLTKVVHSFQPPANTATATAAFILFLQNSGHRTSDPKSKSEWGKTQDRGEDTHRSCSQSSTDYRTTTTVTEGASAIGCTSKA